MAAGNREDAGGTGMAAVWALVRARLRARRRALVGLALLAGVAGTVLVANLVAAWPGRVAARTRPAVALRSE
jgi:hypothetical protein